MDVGETKVISPSTEEHSEQNKSENDGSSLPNDKNVNFNSDEANATPLSPKKSGSKSDPASLSHLNNLSSENSISSNCNNLLNYQINNRYNSDLPLNLRENNNGVLTHKNTSVYDFSESASTSGESPNEMSLVMDDNRLALQDDKDNPQSQSKSGMENRHNLTQSQSQNMAHLSPHNHNFSRSNSSIHTVNHQSNQIQSERSNSINLSQMASQALGSSHGQSFIPNSNYDNSISAMSDYTNNSSSYYDGMIRRGRGRPRGSKNGTGLGRLRGRGYKYIRTSDDPNNCSFDSRNMSDPYSCHKRGRPRSRFIVDLGEQNHEAWTKSKQKLKISDAELTTLLLSLYDTTNEAKDSEESGNVLSLASSEYKKWKDKFASRLSLLTHYASIHNSTCCTCLGIKKKKYIPVGTGKRGRPRKYPPPGGCGDDSGLHRSDVIDGDGNIFEPQIILKDGMMVKNEPLEDKQAPATNNSANSSAEMSEMQQNRSDSNLSAMSINSDTFTMLDRPLTQDEMEKRKDYNKNKAKYICQFCQVHFYHKPNYDYHMSKLESNGKCKIFELVNDLYNCDTCGEGFSWREKLERHLRLAEQHGTHNQKELLLYGDFQCMMCGKSFNKRTVYLQHVKWHEERDDIPCVICGTMFKQTQLRHHLMEVHSNDSIPCSYCGKLFTSRKYLEKHELIHQDGSFPCPECGKVFSQKGDMQAHHRGHALEKEYPCETCGQMLNQRLGLCHHLKKHFPASEFSYECEVCLRYFANEYFLKYHKKKIHNLQMDGVPDDLSDQADYMSSPMSSQMSGEDEREKTTPYALTNNVVKNVLGNALGASLGASVNLTMKNENESVEEGQVSLRNNANMNEHLRHIVEQRDTASHLKNPLSQDDTLRLSDQHGIQQLRESHLHMPQDLTRMNTSQTQISDTSNRMSVAPQAHMSDLRSSASESPSGRMSDASAHMMDNLGRMAVENFGRMSSSSSGYLAEHLRRMAENQSRMTESISHYDERDNYSRLGDNLRNMAARGGSSSSSGSDPMCRLGENLSHMGVIRPSQGTSGSAQWPPHMQNHSALDGMNQSAQSSQHALYTLPFWPYDASLRQYHH